MTMILDGISPRSRSGDPTTSVDAGRSVNLRKSQAIVLAALRARGQGMTQGELEVMLPGMSPSRVRSAVSELAELGKVAPTGETRPTKYGRQAKVWQVRHEKADG